MISRGFPNIITTDVAGTAAWYVELLGWQTEFSSDWFVHLSAPQAAGVELGIIDATHDIVSGFATAGGGAGGAAGVMVTIVVDDVEAVHAAAQSLNLNIVEPPTDLFYGQRRMVLRDPEGTLLDISSECPPSEEFLASLSG
jgi:predicted enzyme related to lactoylglutathione lyase